jgi:hypothetical protein
MTMEIIAPAKRRDLAASSDVRHWKEVIGKSWKAAAASILQVSKDLYDAKTALSKVDRGLWSDLQNQLHDENIISKSIQKKLVPIGMNYNNLIDFGDALPPRYNAIYHLAKLPRPTLEKLAKSNKLTPDLEDKDVAALIESKSGKSQNNSNTPTASIPILRVVQTGKRISPASKETLINSIETIMKISGYDVILSSEGNKLFEDYE